MINPALFGTKNIAFALGIADGTLKTYLAHIYELMGWRQGSLRLLALWVIANASQLGLPPLTLDQFQDLKR